MIRLHKSIITRVVVWSITVISLRGKASKWIRTSFALTVRLSDFLLILSYVRGFPSLTLFAFSPSFPNPLPPPHPPPVLRSRTSSICIFRSLNNFSLIRILLCFLLFIICLNGIFWFVSTFFPSNFVNFCFFLLPSFLPLKSLLDFFFACILVFWWLSLCWIFTFYMFVEFACTTFFIFFFLLRSEALKIFDYYES